MGSMALGFCRASEAFRITSVRKGKGKGRARKEGEGGKTGNKNRLAGKGNELRNF